VIIILVSVISTFFKTRPRSGCFGTSTPAQQHRALPKQSSAPTATPAPAARQLSQRPLCPFNSPGNLLKHRLLVSSGQSDLCSRLWNLFELTFNNLTSTLKREFVPASLAPELTSKDCEFVSSPSASPFLPPTLLPLIQEATLQSLELRTQQNNGGLGYGVLNTKFSKQPTTNKSSRYNHHSHEPHSSAVNPQ